MIIPTNGSELLLDISGANFGPSDTDKAQYTLSLVENTAPHKVAWVSDNSIFKVGHRNIELFSPDGRGRNFFFRIEVGGQTSDPFKGQTIHFSPPSITASNISSTGMNTVGGEIIEFFGKNFGDEATQVAAYTVESNVQNFSNCIINTPHDSIICTTPEGQGANVGVVVVVKSNYSDQSSANYSFLIDYQKPKIFAASLPAFPCPNFLGRI